MTSKNPKGRTASEHERLTLHNALLRERVGLMERAISVKKTMLQNSLNGLAASMGSFANQDNITSFLPLFTSNIYAPLTINFTLLTYLYKTHGILQTMVDEPVLDGLRDGVEITSKELGADDISELEDFMEERRVWETLTDTLCWGRLYGGSGIVINTGGDPSKPLDPKEIRKGMLDFYDADRWEFAGAFRSAQTFSFYGQKLDASRVLTFGGKRAPRLIRITLSGWGMSEIERAVEDFNAWLRGRNVLYEILDEAKVDVYQIKDYAQTLALPDGEQTIRHRVQATNSIKDFHSALILDKEDEYKVVTNSFSGLAEVMKENRIGLASALRMPMTKLFGMSASGFNAGEDDIENYNAMITSQVRRPARSIIRKLIRLCMWGCFGREYEFAFDYKPLRILSAKDEEEIKDSKQTRYERLHEKHLLDSQEMGDLLNKEKLVPIETRAQRGELEDFPAAPTTNEMFESEGETDGKGKQDGEQPGKEDAA